MKTNTFYKPKNEFGEELASKKLLNAAINKLEEKHNNEITALEEAVNKDLTTLENRPFFTVKEIDSSKSIEEYIQWRWSECKTIEERTSLKIEMGQTIYLRKTGEGDDSQFEEYICTNSIDITDDDIKKTTFPANIIFNRLGAVEAIVATTNRHGSVRLLHELYDQSPDAWNALMREETVYGVGNGKHLPVDGLAVAPCALRKFVEADERIDGDLKSLAHDVKIDRENFEKQLKFINEEILGIENSAETDFQNSRLDKHDVSISEINKKDVEQDTTLSDHTAAIDNIKTIIGIDGCCSECHEEGCSCDGCGEALDCNIICKIKSMSDAITSNSDQIAEIDSYFRVQVTNLEKADSELKAVDEELAENIENNSTLIDDINKRIGTKRDTNREQSILGSINELFEVTTQNSNNISKNASAIDQVKDNCEASVADIISNKIGTRPDISGYPSTLWGMSEWVEERLSANEDKANINSGDIISITSTVGKSTDTSDTNGTLYGKTNYLIEQAATNAASISKMDTVVGKFTDSAIEPSTLCGKVNKLTVDLEGVNEKFDNEVENIDIRLKDVEEKSSSNKEKVEAVEGDINDINDKIVNIEETVDGHTELLGSWSDSNPDKTSNAVCGRIMANTNAIESLQSGYTNLDGKVQANADNIDALESNVNDHHNRLNVAEEAIDRVEAIANDAKNKAIEIFDAHHAFNDLILECDIPAEDEAQEGVEAKVALPYSSICDIIKNKTGVEILPSNLSIIFNGARFTVEDTESSAEHFYPEVSYVGKNDADNNSHRALVLTFAGYTKSKHVLISLTYYDNGQVQPSKINIIRIN